MPRADCFHCGEPVTTGERYRVRIDGAKRPVCCPGCQAVAEFIAAAGLADYYRFRTEPAPRPRPPDAAPAAQWLAFDREAVQDAVAQRLPGGLKEIRLVIEGVRCAACSWLIEHRLGAAEGVHEVQVNPATARGRLVWDPARAPLSRLLDTLARLGYRPHPVEDAAAGDVARRERAAALKRLAVAGLGMMQVMTFAVALYAGAWQGMDPEIREFLRWVSMAVATPVVLYAGRPFFAGAWRDLAAGRPGMDVPVALAVGAAWCASLWHALAGFGEVYFDSVTMFVFFLSLGRYAEMAARHRAGATADALSRLTPATALRLAAGDRPEPVGVRELAPGDRVLVRAGDAFPADGRLLSDQAEVDEALLTGESESVTRRAGDGVVGGSVNLGQPVTVRVERVGGDTLVSHLARLLQRAQAGRPGLARVADRVAGWFVTAVLIAAAGVFAWWQLHDPSRAFPVLLSVLVVTCPCALSLATPTALTAATTRLARAGLLVTRPDALERLAVADRLLLDKTGTLTEGRVRLAGARLAPGADGAHAARVAAALEAASEHPVARAFRRPGTTPAQAAKVRPGEGVEGLVDGIRYRIGTPAFVSRLVAGDPPPGSVVLAGERGWLAGYDLADPLRPDAADAVAALAAAGLVPEIVSGDREGAVAEVAAATGVAAWRARQTPEDKLARIRALQAAGHRVAMLGDGVNDAPVLAGADVSVAMGSGAPLAHTSADMVLTGRQLSSLADGVRLARRCLGVVRQNLAWAALYNLVALPLAAAGLVAPWMAAIGMSASSLIVVLNSTRLAGRGPAPAPMPHSPEPARTGRLEWTSSSS